MEYDRGRSPFGRHLDDAEYCVPNINLQTLEQTEFDCTRIVQDANVCNVFDI